MKFSCLLKLSLIIILFSFSELQTLNKKSILSLPKLKYKRNKSGLIEPFRFQSYDDMNKIREKNLLMMNCEILNGKP
jgi:hypothetical protein